MAMSLSDKVELIRLTGGDNRWQILDADKQVLLMAAPADETLAALRGPRRRD